jgi:hypothetical protein
MRHPAHRGPILARAPDVFDIHATPGRRFQERYERRSQTERGRLSRYAAVAAGIVLTLVGIFFLAVPGPGIPILVLGLALIAQESAVTARLLDRAEVRLREWWKRLRRHS